MSAQSLEQHEQKASTTPSRRPGYVVAVIVNAVMLVLVNVRPGWSVLPFLTDAFTEVLPLVNLSLWASLLVNVVYLGFDRAWFVAACQVALSGISLAIAIRMLAVFPFDFSTYSFDWTTVTRVVLWIAAIGSTIAIVVSLARLVRSAARP